MSSENRNAELAKKIAQLMKALDLHQKQDLAALIEVSPTAMLHWERERSSPSAETYIRLAKLSQEKAPELSRWFWQEADVLESDVRFLAPDVNKALNQIEKRLRESTGEFVPVPLVGGVLQGNHRTVIAELRAAIRGGSQKHVLFPKKLIAFPESTVCLPAPDHYMRPIFHAGDMLAVDISCEGEPTKERAYELARMVTERLLVPLGDRAIFAAYYERPADPPRFRGRSGLHARALTLTVDDHGKPTGNIHLQTEIGIDVLAAVEALASRSPLGAKAKPFQDLDEVSDMIIPIDPGVSILGQVVAWIGSAWDPRRQPEREYRLIDNLGVIGGHFNKFAIGESTKRSKK